MAMTPSSMTILHIQGPIGHAMYLSYEACRRLVPCVMLLSTTPRGPDQLLRLKIAIGITLRDVEVLTAR